jgi:hypothetical protein
MMTMMIAHGAALASPESDSATCQCGSEVEQLVMAESWQGRSKLHTNTAQAIQWQVRLPRRLAAESVRVRVRVRLHRLGPGKKRWRGISQSDSDVLGTATNAMNVVGAGHSDH